MKKISYVAPLCVVLLLCLTAIISVDAAETAPTTLPPAATPFPALDSLLHDIPFPRTYALFLNGPTVSDGDYNQYKCLHPDYKQRFEEMGVFANIVEMFMQWGANDPRDAYQYYASMQPWRVPDDADRDGGCDVDDPKLVDWLQTHSDALGGEGEARGKNRWGQSVPHYQIGFVYTWNYVDPLPPFFAGGFALQQNKAIHQCDEADGDPFSPPTYRAHQTWALHASDGQLIRWKDTIYAVANVFADSSPGGDLVCNQATSPGGAIRSWRYVDWLPVWLHERIGEVSAWDGIRIEAPGNIHAFWTPRRADQDLDGCNDYTQSAGPVLSGPCPTRETAEGRKYVDQLYREGNQYIFQRIHTGADDKQTADWSHPNWLIGAADAWMPAADDDTYVSGFARMPDLNYTLVDNWTNKWGDDGLYTFAGWANPDTGRFETVDFATTIRIWEQWSYHGNGRKGYVILSKCGYYDQPASWDCSNHPGMFKEFRFSLAAATLLDAFHSFVRDGDQLVPHWFDEYAVYPDNLAASIRPGQTAAESDRAKGIGWLGFGVSPMMRVDADGNALQTVTEALSSDRWQTDINDHVWLRYFEHGVTLLNPTNMVQSIRLQGSFHRILCSERQDSDPENDNAANCLVNNGEAVADRVDVPTFDGLLLVRDIESYPTPSPLPTSTPMATLTPSFTPTATLTPSSTPAPTLTISVSVTPTLTSTLSPVQTASPTSTPSPVLKRPIYLPLVTSAAGSSNT